MCSLINKQLLLTAYAYLFIMEQQKVQQGSEALELRSEGAIGVEVRYPGFEKAEAHNKAVDEFAKHPLQLRCLPPKGSSNPSRKWPGLAGSKLEQQFKASSATEKSELLADMTALETILKTSDDATEKDWRNERDHSRDVCIKFSKCETLQEREDFIVHAAVFEAFDEEGRKLPADFNAYGDCFPFYKGEQTPSEQARRLLEEIGRLGKNNLQEPLIELEGVLANGSYTSAEKQKVRKDFASWQPNARQQFIEKAEVRQYVRLLTKWWSEHPEKGRLDEKAAKHVGHLTTREALNKWKKGHQKHVEEFEVDAEVEAIFDNKKLSAGAKSVRLNHLKDKLLGNLKLLQHFSQTVEKRENAEAKERGPMPPPPQFCTEQQFD